MGSRDWSDGGFHCRSVEKLLGIESPQRKAHDDIKSIYGVDIPQNSGTIKQVVQIAQSQFGGDIAVAVRSPSVASTGDAVFGSHGPEDATVGHDALRREPDGAGWQAYQQASYQDGQAHVYARTFQRSAVSQPGPIPRRQSEHGRRYRRKRTSLNISGADAANFMTGQFVTPSS